MTRTFRKPIVIYPAGTRLRDIPPSFEGISWQEYVWHCNQDTPRVATAPTPPAITPRKKR